MAVAKSRGTARTDAELARQLDAARGTDRAVEAVVWLTPSEGDSALQADEVESAAESALRRVEEEVGSAPTTVNLLKNLGVVVVAGEEPFLRRLLEQPEVASAVANAPEESSTAG
jgi:hypothetical protein